MSGKGSRRRPGEGYEQAWERIFGKRPGDKPVEPVKPTEPTEEQGDVQTD